MHVACRQPRYAKSESKPEWQCSLSPESITAIASASIYPKCWCPSDDTQPPA
jgi:hypothetical protein